jgi:hypothetical protein
MNEFKGLRCSDCRVVLDVMAEPGPLVVLCRRCWFKRMSQPGTVMRGVFVAEGASCPLEG